jgi:radical SAM protein with 4Fe4S-binding SPASM domain
VYFITNGLLLNKEKNIEKLIELNPVVKISLQILDTAAHKLKRGINIEFERYSETILSFIQKIAKTKLQVIIDIGSNFNDNKVKYFLKKFFGLSVGDPNLPNTYNDTLDVLKSFLINNNVNLREKYILNLINSDYTKQTGIQVSDNVKIKIKNFHYGNRLKDFFPINDNFKCDTSILSVQSTGEVVPCCLTYDASLSLGQIKKSSLEEILNNNSFLKNLRTKGLKKNIVCKKCYGEPTKRGAFLRNIINLIK